LIYLKAIHTRTKTHRNVRVNNNVLHSAILTPSDTTNSAASMLHSRMSEIRSAVEICSRYGKGVDIVDSPQGWFTSQESCEYWSVCKCHAVTTTARTKPSPANCPLSSLLAKRATKATSDLGATSKVINMQRQRRCQIKWQCSVAAAH